MLWISENEATPQEAAQRWVEENEAQVRGWTEQ